MFKATEKEEMRKQNARPTTAETEEWPMDLSKSSLTMLRCQALNSDAVADY